MTVPERILTRVLVMEDGCHEWIGYLNRNGYGRTKIEGRTWQIHRFFYARAGKYLPDYFASGMELDHLCRNRSCCNVRHLELVTKLENMQRVAALQTHCRNGHEYTDENTGFRHDRLVGIRYCKECNRQNCRKYQLRKKGN